MNIMQYNELSLNSIEIVRLSSSSHYPSNNSDSTSVRTLNQHSVHIHGPSVHGI